MECSSTLLYEEFPLHAEHSEIRLLLLHPNGWHGPIFCDFQVVSLNDRPEYSALSYVWGQEDAIHEISLGGRPFWVRPNLFTALRRLRAHGVDNTIIIWVDALCINQSSVAERNSQVAMMGEIYSQSERVQVWLGESDLAHDIWPESTIGRDPGRCYDFSTVNNTLEWSPSRDEHENQFFGALDGLSENETFLRVALFLQFMAKHSEFRRTYLFWNPTSNAYLRRQWEQVLLAIHKNSWHVEKSSSCSCLLTMIRFDRLWVVQEVVLAPTVTVLMGPVALPLDTIVQAREAHLQHKQWPYYGGFHHAASEALLETAILPFVDTARLRNHIRDRAASLTLAELRLQLSRRAATVDLDQVFSLLGLTAFLRNAGETPTIQDGVEMRAPDYTSTPEDIYKSITQRHLQERLDLLPLSISSHKEAHPETPSWTVDWTVLQGASLGFNQLLWTRGYTLFQADRRMTVSQRDFQWSQKEKGLELQLHGRFVDRITISTPFATLFNNDNAFLLAMRRHEPELPYPGAEITTWSNAWLRCITADSVTTNDS